MWRNGSAVDCLSNGCGFEPHHFRFFKYTEIFQLVEFGLWEPEVVSSSLAFRTKDVLSFEFWVLSCAPTGLNKFGIYSAS